MKHCDDFEEKAKYNLRIYEIDDPSFKEDKFNEGDVIDWIDGVVELKDGLLTSDDKLVIELDISNNYNRIKKIISKWDVTKTEETL